MEDQLASLPEAEQAASSTIAQTKVATDDFDPASSDPDDFGGVCKPFKKRAKTDEVRFCAYYTVKNETSNPVFVAQNNPAGLNSKQEDAAIAKGVGGVYRYLWPKSIILRIRYLLVVVSGITIFRSLSDTMLRWPQATTTSHSRILSNRKRRALVLCASESDSSAS